MTNARFLFALASFPLFAAGCTTDPAPAALNVQASWQPWQDDNIPHLVIVITNSGGQTAYVGPNGSDLTISGPDGVVPIDWGGTDFARPMAPGSSVTVGFHPRTMNGGLTMAIDHSHPMPMAPLPGTYTVCLENECSRADLA